MKGIGLVGVLISLWENFPICSEFPTTNLDSAFVQPPPPQHSRCGYLLLLTVSARSKKAQSYLDPNEGTSRP